MLPNERYHAYEGVDFDTYYNDLLGVTKSEKDRAHKVVLQFNKFNAPYVITKPLHHSQQVVSEDEQGIVIRIDVVLNFELEREILGFGESVKVLSQHLLQSRIRRRLEQAAERYLNR